MRAVIVACWLVTATVASAETPLKGNVLVWADAKWHVDADEKATTIQLGDLGRKGRLALGAVLPAKVISTNGDFVEVELGGASDCAWSKTGTELANMRLFVKRADLANVLSKPFRASYKNGSRISLMPGVPIERGRISINGDEVELAVPATSIGLSYPTPRPSARPDRRKAKEHFSVEGDVLLGDIKMMTKQIAPKVVKRGANVLFPVQAPCIDAVVVAPKEALMSNALDFGTAGILGVGGRPIQERWYIAKGTPMRAASGRVVAKAREDIDLVFPIAGEQSVCHKTELDIRHVETEAPTIQETAAAARTLELCVPGNQVKHENPRPPKF